MLIDKKQEQAVVAEELTQYCQMVYFPTKNPNLG
jgi:hypothetical protein